VPHQNDFAKNNQKDGGRSRNRPIFPSQSRSRIKMMRLRNTDLNTVQEFALPIPKLFDLRTELAGDGFREGIVMKLLHVLDQIMFALNPRARGHSLSFSMNYSKQKPDQKSKNQFMK
jgi:hypothetical protein